MKGKSALTLLLAGIFSCGTCQATGAEVTSESVFNILNSTGAATDKSYLSLNPDKYPNYRLLIHSAKLQNEIKSHYTKDEIQGLLTLTENTRKLTLTEKPWGTFILASTFEDDKTAAETHYDAVWLRDSLWGYMALVSDQGNSVAAKKVLLTLWDYMSTPDLNRPGFPGECFICELRLPDHRFRWKHNKLFLLLPEEYGPAFPAIVDCYTSPPT